MSSKDLFNTDKENIPNNILSILEQDTSSTAIQEIPKPKQKGRPSKSDKPPSEYHVRKQMLADLKEENAKLRALLEKPVIVAPTAIAKLPEPVVKTEPVKAEPVVTTIEEIIKTIRPTKGRFW